MYTDHRIKTCALQTLRAVSDKPRTLAELCSLPRLIELHTDGAQMLIATLASIGFVYRTPQARYDITPMGVDYLLSEDYGVDPEEWTD